MGRHSAGDDDDADDAVVADATLDLGSGRHASADDGEAPGPDEQLTQMIAVVDPDVETDDRRDTDVLVLPDAMSGSAPEVARAVESEAPRLPDILPLTEAPAKPSRADQRAMRKAEKAAQKAGEEAERQALKEADEAAAAAQAAAAGESAAALSAAAVPTDEPAVKPDKKHKPAKVDRARSGTRADLDLLRQNNAVRARCVAGVLVSFLLYTVVLLVVGRSDVYLLWIWIPIVLSGVLVGTVLDLAHRAAARKT